MSTNRKMACVPKIAKMRGDALDCPAVSDANKAVATLRTTNKAHGRGNGQDNPNDQIKWNETKDDGGNVDHHTVSIDTNPFDH